MQREGIFILKHSALLNAARLSAFGLFSHLPGTSRCEHDLNLNSRVKSIDSLTNIYLFRPSQNEYCYIWK